MAHPRPQVSRQSITSWQPGSLAGDMNNQPELLTVHDVATEPRPMAGGREATPTGLPRDQNCAWSEPMAGGAVTGAALGLDAHAPLLDGYQPKTSIIT
jgi:hypothetical protein